MDKRILKRLLNERVFVFLGIIVVLMVTGVFWRKEIFLLSEQIREFLVSRKEILLSGISLHLKRPLELIEEPEEPLEIILPEIKEEVEEKEELEEVGIGAPIVGEEPSVKEQEPVIPPSKEGKCQMSLDDIEEQVNEISGKVEAISQRVAQLVEASSEREFVVEEEALAQVTQQTKSEQLAEIEEQIRGITAKVEIISQAVAELVEAHEA